MLTKPSIPAKKRKQMRQFILLGMLGFLALTAFLVLKAFEKNIIFFVTPSDLQERVLTGNEKFRLGGLITKGSVLKSEDSLKVTFLVTDGGGFVPVVFEGILPDLFREGQGVVVEGVLLESGIFRADQVLAKHDENYMPAEVAEALKRNGQWRGEDDPSFP